MKISKLNVNASDIPYVKEEKIHKDIFYLESVRSSLYQKKEPNFLESVKSVEVELCYLQREVDIRRRRKAAHSEFMQKKMRNKNYNRARRR